MGRAEVAAIRRKYHILRNERTAKRNKDKKELNDAQHRERDELSARHRAADRALQEQYEEDYRELGAVEGDELEGAQR